MSISICQSNACHHFGVDQNGVLRCLLFTGRSCAHRDHIGLGGGCIHPTNPLFQPHPRFIAKGHPVPQPKDPSDPTTHSSMTAEEIAAVKSKPTGVPYPIHHGGIYGMTSGNPDVDGMQLIGQAFAAMTPEGRRAAIAWINARYPNEPSHPA